MSVLQIVCQNCGAKYKLPESFQGDKAKCKACGAVIDVAAQRAGGGSGGASSPKPAELKPAGAKPAAARPTRSASSGRAAGSSRGAAGSSRGAAETSGGAGSSRRSASASGGRAAGGRRGAAEATPKKKGNPALLIGGIVVVVAIVVAVLMSGGDEPKPTEQTQTAQGTGGSTESNTGTTPAAAQQTPAESTSTGAGAAPEAATPASEQPATEEATQTPEPKKPEPAKPAPAPAKTEVTTRADVFDPKTLDALEYPAEVDSETQATIAEALQDLADGGVAGIRAKGKLEEIGWPAIFGIINYLRTLDYFDSDASMTAYELNRLLEAMAVGINVGYRPPQIGEEQSLEDVDWNAKTVKAWIRLPTKYPTAEDFDRLRQNRQTRNQGR